MPEDVDYPILEDIITSSSQVRGPPLERPHNIASAARVEELEWLGMPTASADPVLIDELEHT
jgi:hypothetical protein